MPIQAIFFHDFQLRKSVVSDFEQGHFFIFPLSCIKSGRVLVTLGSK